MARPQLDACLRALQPGTTLAVWKLDWLGRTVKGLASLLDELEERGVGFRSLTEGIDTASHTGRPRRADRARGHAPGHFVRP